MAIAVYPGSFNPFTIGHLDVVQAASRMFDKIIICIAVNFEKQNSNNLEKRKEQVQSILEEYGLLRENNIEVKFTDQLIVQFCHDNSADFLIKGIRNTIDFEKEYDQAISNRALSKKLFNQEIETVWIPARPEHRHISSTLLRELKNYDVSL
ncbi:MAG: pantetheine-phosphate adenylyltransferase [Candidatus Ancillula sp.]|jgi:pantetheine-phosphate adenylyltransferase|nr:pantetheine-phosphate adenylyltransferase [Candidatus Ancillula sp.]